MRNQVDYAQVSKDKEESKRKNRELISAINKNYPLQFEMLKYNAKQVEMFMLYGVSLLLLLITFAFELYVFSLLIVLVNIVILILRNKVIFVSECIVKDVHIPRRGNVVNVDLSEINTTHRDIFRYYEDIHPNEHLGKYGKCFNAIAFSNLCKNKDMLVGDEQKAFIEKLKQGDKGAKKISAKMLSEVNIFPMDKIFAFKTLSGYVYCIKEKA